MERVRVILTEEETTGRGLGGQRKGAGEQGGMGQLSATVAATEPTRFSSFKRTWHISNRCTKQFVSTLLRCNKNNDVLPAQVAVTAEMVMTPNVVMVERTRGAMRLQERPSLLVMTRTLIKKALTKRDSASAVTNKYGNLSHSDKKQKSVVQVCGAL